MSIKPRKFASVSLGTTCLTALAASFMLMAPVNDAAAAEKAKKMSIGVSGSFLSVVAFGKQNASFESTANSTARTGYDGFNIWNDSEIHFSGVTRLDNGVNVEVVVELETDTVKGGASIDDSFVRLTGGFGEIQVGAISNAVSGLSTVAPSAGVTSSNDGDGGNVIIAPDAVSVSADTLIGTGNEMRIAYYSPTFSGFTVGASFMPSSETADTMPAVGGNGGTDTQEYNIALGYNAKLGSLDVSADVGYGETHGDVASSSKGWRTGINIGFGNVVVGGSYRKTSEIDNLVAGTASSPEETAFDAGITYASGSWAIGVNILNVTAPKSTAVQGDDESTQVFLGASYNLGPGIDLLGNVFRVDWDDETTADANNNDGWGALGGISIAF